VGDFLGFGRLRHANRQVRGRVAFGPVSGETPYHIPMSLFDSPAIAYTPIPIRNGTASAGV